MIECFNGRGFDLNNHKKIIISAFVLVFAASGVFAINDNDAKTKKSLFPWIKKNNQQTSTTTQKKAKKARVEEITLPPVTEGKPKIPFSQLKAMTIEDCVNEDANRSEEHTSDSSH